MSLSDEEMLGRINAVKEAAKNKLNIAEARALSQVAVALKRRMRGPSFACSICGGKKSLASFYSKYRVSVDGRTQYLRLPIAGWETTEYGDPFPGKDVRVLILSQEEGA